MFAASLLPFAPQLPLVFVSDVISHSLNVNPVRVGVPSVLPVSVVLYDRGLVTPLGMLAGLAVFCASVMVTVLPFESLTVPFRVAYVILYSVAVHCAFSVTLPHLPVRLVPDAYVVLLDQLPTSPVGFQPPNV